nr:MAG TPA: hypothetical protein [Caudoviricetes sp.]
MKRKQQDTYELTQTIQYGRCTIQIMRPVFKTPEERAARERQVAEELANALSMIYAREAREARELAMKEAQAC